MPLALLYQAILDRGSEIVVPVPAWATFAEAARVAGATPVFVPLSERNAFRVTARAVAKAITPKTRAVVVNSPSNPTGAVIEPEELLKIARLARKHGFWILYDDTYAHLLFRKEGPPALQGVKDAAGGHLVVVGTVSKTYCMSGWRVGWVMGPKALAEACTALNSHSVPGPATFAQVAAAEALTAPQDVVREMAAEYRLSGVAPRSCDLRVSNESSLEDEWAVKKGFEDVNDSLLPLLNHKPPAPVKSINFCRKCRKG